MKEKIEFVRLPALLLLIFFLGKLIMSQLGTPYEVGLQFFSMVTLQVHLCLVWPAVARRYKGCGIWGAVQVGILIALASQILIFFGTGLSYLIGDTHFNYPAALNQEGPVGFVAAMQRRAGGLVVNALIGGVTAGIGWFMGGVIPLEQPRSQQPVAEL